MSAELEFLTPTDKPALLGLTTPELIEAGRTALEQLGYKVHTAENHADFLSRFHGAPYQVVLIEEGFAAVSALKNESLIALQQMPMNLRRHTVVMLFGFAFTTLHPMQAFHQGVHAVLNPADGYLLIQLIQKVVAEYDIFLHQFREAKRAAA
jgi:DNA-binding NtrC family response regulator